MDYSSTVEIAKKWGISERRVAKLCADSRIPGAKLIGHTWLIPEAADKPTDARVRSGKYAKGERRVKRGSVGEVLNQVFEADCLEKMRELPARSIDMILCDLPYGMTQNEWDSYIPLDQLWQEYERIIKPNGVIALTATGVFTAMLILSKPDLYKYKWVWEKSKPTNFLNAKKQPLRKHEDICIFYKNQPPYHPQMTQGEAYDKGVRKNQLSGSYGEFSPVHVHSPGLRYPTDILYVKTAESEGEVVHPTQKPVELGRYLIRTYTNPGAVVLDNACGSGSFLVSALLEGRNFIGIEKNENVALFKTGDIDYIRVCAQRLRAAWETVPPDKRRYLRRWGLLEQYPEEVKTVPAIKVNRNERSSAIELISELNLFLAKNKHLRIKRVGGELTINTGRVRMFPDLVLYGDENQSQYLQGWELKMPNTPITDEAFIKDAHRKAVMLGLNSFFLWNFTAGVLYTCGEDGEFTVKKQWNQTQHIRSHRDVDTYKQDWLSLLKDILVEIDGYISEGALRATRLDDFLSEGVMGLLIESHKEATAEYLQAVSCTDAVMEAQIAEWWNAVGQEYASDEEDRYRAYAKMLLLGWCNRIAFAHRIKPLYGAAGRIEALTWENTPEEGDRVLEEIGNSCGFYHMFHGAEYCTLLPEETWHGLADFNAFLTEHGITSVEQVTLQQILESTVRLARRELAGQFATPTVLADLLVRLTVLDYTKDCMDPCCGTGSISKAVLENKKRRGLEAAQAVETTWASDKYAFPLQIAQLSLTEPESGGSASRLFQSNALGLRAGGEVAVPRGQGGTEKLRLPKMHAVVSNLPFVPFELIGVDEMDYTASMAAELRESCGVRLGKRNDFYAYIALSLWNILEEDGRMGVITSNSWLGTEAGLDFWHALSRHFHVEQVHISGTKRWFEGTKVVTTALILTKRSKIAEPPDGEKTAFCVWHRDLEQLGESAEEREQLVRSALLQRELNPGVMRMQTYTHGEIRELQEMGISLRTLFQDVGWLLEIKRRDKLCPIGNVFHKVRGERRGWDKLFYPQEGHGIEKEYIRQVLKSTREVEYLSTSAEGDAFCCSLSKEELEARGHTGALSWIQRFEQGVNTNGRPLVEVLHRKNLIWYEMQDTNTADLVTSVNPDERLFFARFKNAAFINQRVIGLKKKPGLEDEALDLDLCHALLNSVIGMFYIEAIGFGRGQGALDLNSNAVLRACMLNPEKVAPADKAAIIKAFQPLLNRRIQSTARELADPKRRDFDLAVLAAFGLEEFYDQIRDSLLLLQGMRLKVRRHTPAKG